MVLNMAISHSASYNSCNDDGLYNFYFVLCNKLQKNTNLLLAQGRYIVAFYWHFISDFYSLTIRYKGKDGMAIAGMDVSILAVQGSRTAIL